MNARDTLNADTTYSVIIFNRDPLRWPAAGQTPLTLAAHGGHVDVVVALLEAGADPDAADANGATLESIAAEHENEALRHAVTEWFTAKELQTQQGKKNDKEGKSKND